jgi:small subunit ribosomal protein S6
MVILKPLLPDDARKAFHKSFTDLCAELKGTVEDTDIWGKRYLAYKISVYQEGYYILYTFSLPSDALKEFKRQMDLKQEIIRYLLVNVDEKDIQKKSIKKKQMDVNI